MNQSPYAIVGACTDLGLGLAWRLSELGYPLLLIDTDAEKLSRLADEIEAKGYPVPLLAAVDANLHSLEQQCLQLVSQIDDLSGFVAATYWLDQPVPLPHDSLQHWQTSLMYNLHYPLWLLKSLASKLLPSAQATIAIPKAEHYSVALAPASILWQSWMPMLATEISLVGRLHAWPVPRVADRVHRRIWPVLPVDQFVAIDDVITNWLMTWQE